MLGGNCILDLPYAEDKDAEVDANIVMTGGGKFVEIQSTGEEATFDDANLSRLLELAKKGISQISELQIRAIESASAKQTV